MSDERNIAINRGVYALGICVVPDKLVKTMRTSLDAMQGADWVEVPYSLARSMHDTLELHIVKKLPYLKDAGVRGKLMVLDMQKGNLRLTPLGELAMKKLADKLHKRA